MTILDEEDVQAVFNAADIPVFVWSKLGFDLRKAMVRHGTAILHYDTGYSKDGHDWCKVPHISFPFAHSFPLKCR